MPARGRTRAWSDLHGGRQSPSIGPQCQQSVEPNRFRRGGCGIEQEHTDTIRKLVWSADERRALSAGHDGTVRLWDVEDGRCRRVLTGHPVGVVTVA